MNKHNINKSNAAKILTWCKRTYGKSQFKKTYPILKFHQKPFEKDDYGEYISDDNIIYVYGETHNSFIDFINTIIHEYVHYLQDPIMYQRYFKKHKKSYDSHPYEIKAQDISWKDQRQCLRETFLKTYKNK